MFTAPSSISFCMIKVSFLVRAGHDLFQRNRKFIRIKNATAGPPHEASRSTKVPVPLLNSAQWSDGNEARMVSRTERAVATARSLRGDRWGPIARIPRLDSVAIQGLDRLHMHAP